MGCEHVDFTSVRKRARQTLWTVLGAVDQMWLSEARTGSSVGGSEGSGLSKAETTAKRSEAQ